MSKKKQTLIEWLDDQVEQGNEVILKWDGGNDSGWVHLEIDGQDVENEYTETLINYMDNYLDYGSWAGDFNANGEAKYSPEYKAFVGTDYYSETGTMSYDVDIELVIPKHLWFNDLEVHIECEYEDTPNIEASFGIKNGFLTEEHREIEQALSIDIKDKIEAAISDWQYHTGLQFESMWEDITLVPTDFKEDGGGNVIGVIHSVQFRYPEEEPKDIYLDVNEIQNQLNEQD